MTSPDPHRRETVETGETRLAYSGGFIDRAANQRSDPGFLDATLAKASTRLIPMWRDHCVVSGEPSVPVILPAAEAGAVLDAAAEGERVLDVRALVGTLRPAEAALLGYARGILYWHRHQRYCGSCGSPTRIGHGGHLRTCQNKACARLHFPRVEPAVIMLVENQGRCLLARHNGSGP